MKLYDRYLVASVTALVCMGLLMVASASMVISDRTFGEPFYFLLHQTVFLVAGVLFSWFLFRFSMDQWQKISAQLLLLSLLLLSLVLIPGLGHEVNGSMRWIGIGPLGIQVSEFAKLAMIIYLASYLVRRHDEVKNRMRGFLKPLLVIGVMAVLLLKEPDFWCDGRYRDHCIGHVIFSGRENLAVYISFISRRINFSVIGGVIPLSCRTINHVHESVAKRLCQWISINTIADCLWPRWLGRRGIR